MAKEIERAGIPTALVTAIIPLAQSVGPNRIIAGRAVLHPLGDPTLSREEERAFRRRLVGQALEALQTDLQQPLVVPLPRPRQPSSTRAERRGTDEQR